MTLSRVRIAGRALTSHTPALLAAVAVLQVLDWQSTLWARNGRAETNHLLNWLGHWAAFVVVFSCIKLVFLAVLLCGYLYWRRHKGLYEFEYTACLSTLVVAYGVVVINNYRP